MAVLILTHEHDETFRSSLTVTIMKLTIGFAFSQFLFEELERWCGEEHWWVMVKAVKPPISALIATLVLCTGGRYDEFIASLGA